MNNPHKKVLILEDDKEIGELLSNAIIDLGFKVRLVADGSQASSIVTTEKFDFIVLDINVPSLNGLQVAAICRSTNLNRATPLCIASGQINGDAERRIKSLKIGHVIEKPFSIKSLVDLIRSSIEAQNKPPITYDVKIINGFILGSKEIFEYYFDHTPEMKAVKVKSDDDFAPGIVSGLIGFTANEVRGSMAICVNDFFIKGIVAKLFGGVEVDLNAETMSDIIGEYCNQVLGAVKREMGKLGIGLQLGLPDVVFGENHKIVHKIRNPVLQVTFSLGKKSCVLEFCLEQTDIKPDADSIVESQAIGKVKML